jgi:phage/conjugal plasmid C-4 type zinc finger TraR family protein
MVARSSLAIGHWFTIYWEGIADKDSEMASGWAPDGAVQDQIDDTVADAVKIARAKLPVGESLFHCTECGEPIAEGRRRAVPGVRTCVECQSARDARPVASGINRRGSKDSQLR